MRLIDAFGRHIHYVRISATDRCNFRCLYCMPERASFAPRAQILTLEEIALVARVFTELGVDKIRLTGGEPLARENIFWLCRQISALPGLRELVMTTNGALLEQFAVPLREAGVKRLNISLDSVDRDTFARLTRRDQFDAVMAGIDAALAAGFERVKLNAVVLRDYNHTEILDLAAFALDKGLDLTFIEEMPLGEIASHDRRDAFYGRTNILRDLQSRYTLLPSTDTTHGPASYYRVYRNGVEQRARIGLIAPHSENFCARCNRVRLTAEGRLLLCLGQENSLDLRRLIRAHPGQPAVLREALIAAMRQKPKSHEFDLAAPVKLQRYMNHSGG